MLSAQPRVGLNEKLCEEKDQEQNIWNLEVEEFCSLAVG
jgi:hypothetical protein